MDINLFTGIVQGTAQIIKKTQQQNYLSLEIKFPKNSLTDLKIGASIAIDGVCLTTTRIDENSAHFDVISETLTRSTLGNSSLTQTVNFERSARMGDEIGGHVLSGHVFEKAKIISSETKNELVIFKLSCSRKCMKYIFEKGYIALNGCSLTVMHKSENDFFSIHLIPETLRSTNWSLKNTGDYVNLEIDSTTQIIVDTTTNTLKNNHKI